MSDLIKRSDVLDILGNVFATTLNVEVDAAIAAMMCKIKYMPKVEPDDTTEAYNKGLNDSRNEVWELADKLNNMPMQDIIDIYGFNVDRCSVYSKITPQETLAKLEAYEKEQEKAKQKIMVGDIITLEDGTKGVVMDEDGVDNVVIFTENGCIEAWMNKKYIKKTGKHIDIQSLLEQIKE